MEPLNDDLHARVSLPFWPDRQARAIQIIEANASIHAVQFKATVRAKIVELENGLEKVRAETTATKEGIEQLKRELKSEPRGSWVLAGCYFVVNAATFGTEFVVCWTTLNPLFGSDPYSLQGILLGLFVPSVLFALKPAYEWLIEEPYRESLADPETHGHGAVWVRRLFLLGVTALNLVNIVLMAINRDQIIEAVRALAQGQDQISIDSRAFVIAMSISAAVDGALFFHLVTFYASSACRRRRNERELKDLERRLPSLEQKFADALRDLTDYHERERNIETLANEEQRCVLHRGLLALAQRVTELRKRQSARERVDLLTSFGIRGQEAIGQEGKLPN